MSISRGIVLLAAVWTLPSFVGAQQVVTLPPQSFQGTYFYPSGMPGEPVALGVTPGPAGSMPAPSGMMPVLFNSMQAPPGSMPVPPGAIPLPPGAAPVPPGSAPGPAAPGVQPSAQSLAGCCVPQYKPELYFTADTLLLQLSRPDGRALAIDQDTDDVVLSTRDLDYDFQVGPRIAMGVIDDCTSCEVDFFTVHGWQDSYTVVGDRNLRVPGDLAFETLDFENADAVRARSLAKIYNAELNVFQQVGRPGLALLAGFRWIEFDERFRLTSGVVDFDPSDYRVHADDRLWGGQVGFRWRREARRLGMEVLGKSGIFGRDSDQRTVLRDNSNTVLLQDTDADTHKVAFVNELGLTGTYRVNNTWLARAGYDFILINGVTRAADQLDFTTERRASLRARTGDALLHGFVFGMEGRW